MEKIKQKIYKNLKMRGRTLSFFGQSQYGDWKILMTIFSISILFVVVFGIFSFINNGTEVDLYGSNSGAPVGKKIKKEVLTGMISRMEERQKSFDSLKLNKPVVGDPSN